MSDATEEAVQIPPHYFKAKCQNPDCRQLLGGFHIPAVGGLVVFGCQKCGRTSVFKNEAYGIRSALAGPLAGEEHQHAPGQRRR